jgi:hypothetical protein
VDLSAVIFVVLALAWAAYLIPKALKHHDEMASDRLVEGHSERVRILSRKGKAAHVEVPDEEAAEPAVEESAAPDEPAKKQKQKRARKPRPVLSPAGRAARRRRRVLATLVLALAAVWALTWYAYLPIWAPGVPGALVVGWLVIARLSVRRQQRRRSRRPSAVEPVETTTRQAVEPEVVERVETTTSTTAHAGVSAEQFLDDLADEDTSGLDRQEIEAALASEGSLWDPLPLTLPTYVNKARARRTVRTIELTGMTSSGHDESDTALAREAAAKKESSEQASKRRVAGA